MGVWENRVNADEGAVGGRKKGDSIGHGNGEDDLGSIGETTDAAVVNIASRALQDGRGDSDEPRGEPEYLDYGSGNNIRNI